MCVCRAITSCQYIVAGVYHALRVTGLASPYQTHFTCAMFHIWLAGGLFLEMLDLAFLVIDRIISIAFPMRYWNMKAKQAIIVCISLYFVANGIKTVPILAFNDLNAPTVCVNSFSSLTENLAYFAQLADNVILGLVIGLQALLMGFVYYRSKRAASTEAERRSIERQLALLPILRRQIILHCGMQIVSKTLLSANLFVADQYVSVRLAACGSMMVTFDIFVNTSVILLNKDMRKACLQAIKRTSNQVSSMVHVRVTSTVWGLSERFFGSQMGCTMILRLYAVL